MSNSCYALVITPYPDDAEYGVAGTVAKWVREGKDVIYVVCTNGNKGSNDPQMTPEKLARIREEEQLAAARVLGVKQVAAFKSPEAKTLLGYHRAVLKRSKEYILSLSKTDLDRELNEPWYKPLPTIGVRLVSIMEDSISHAGQAGLRAWPAPGQRLANILSLG